MPGKSSIDGVVAVAAAAAVSLGPVPHAVPAGAALPGAGAAPPHVLPAGSAPEGLAAAAAAVNLCFQGNFPQHAWRTRFQAFCLSSPISHATRQEHIHALAAKEGMDPARAWTQFFEAFPHAARYHKECGDARQSWITYLKSCCRKTRHPRDWRPEADCIAPLVIAFLGIMDGSSDIERNFSTLGIVECRPVAARGSELLEPCGDFPKLKEGLVQPAAAADVGDSLRFAGAGAAGGRRRRRRLAELSRKMPPASSAAAAAVADDQEQQQQPPPPPPLGETAAAPAPTAEGSEVADPVEPSSTASPGK